MHHYIWLIPAFPLLGSILNGFLGKAFGKRFVSFVGPLAVGFAFLQSVILFFTMLSADGNKIHESLYVWMGTSTFQLDIAFQVDVLSAFFLLFITGIGFLIHVYSIGYMHEEDGYYRFFSYLNLFVFFMLILVLADNFLLMFVGWEGVGLCSYLLIGYYFDKNAAALASKKAFVVNRIGDFGFLAAILLIFISLGTLNFDQVNANAADVFPVGGILVTAITLLLFLGATGKSAQIPLYIWLPDAMEGPTPVSALIHAATMVTSGLYMLARLSHLFVLAPVTMNVIAVIGVATALLAACIAITQTDIKRVLAYSTVSQLGYMFLAMGVGAFGAGVFHVLTHAFFKALLFLCSGSVIHALHHEQDMRNMGGLKSKLPLTYATMLIGTIAIAGIPPFAGFFSKDEILWKAWISTDMGKVLWGVGFLTAILTSFYMFRLIFMTFHGRSRVSPGIARDIHESPVSMTFPLVVLAFLSIIGGFFGVPHILHFFPNGIEIYFEGFFAKMPSTAEVHGALLTEAILMILSVGAALIAAIVAGRLYSGNLDRVTQWQAEWKVLHNLSVNKFYVDEIYELLIAKPLKIVSDQVLWRMIDSGMIDRAILMSTNVTRSAGGLLKLLQNGVLQQYAIAFVTGTLLILWYLVFLH